MLHERPTQHRAGARRGLGAYFRTSGQQGAEGLHMFYVYIYIYIYIYIDI